MKGNGITEKAYEFVYQLLNDKLPDYYYFHNHVHTEAVAENAREIGKKAGLSDEDVEAVTLAALFHDTGYTVSNDTHEDESIKIAREFLSANAYPEDRIELVVSCIEATKYPHKPKSLIEGVICDSDLSHLASDDYTLKSDLLRMEWETIQGKNYSEFDWLKTNIDFFTHQKYFTKFAVKNFEPKKVKNLIALQKRLRKELEKEGDYKKKKAKLDFEKEKLEQKKKDSKKADRGVETMFRNTIRTHVEFSGLADNKANIMISINTLIIGGIVTILLRKLDSNPHLITPTFMLLTTSLLCIIFAILAARPKISEGKFTKQDIMERKTNLLFFGNFFNMELKDFTWGMKEMMNDKDYLYGSMIKDLYFLGQAVGRKYKYINICFNIFMYGIILSTIAYIIAVLSVPDTNLNLFE